MSDSRLSRLAEGLVRRNNMPYREAETFVRQFFDIIAENIFRENIVKVKGLGTFKLVGVEPRESVNVNSGDRIVIPGHTKLSFTPDAVLRDAVNKPFAEFVTVILNENTSLEEMEAMDDNLPASELLVTDDKVTPIHEEVSSHESVPGTERTPQFQMETVLEPEQESKQDAESEAQSEPESNLMPEQGPKPESVIESDQVSQPDLDSEHEPVQVPTSSSRRNTWRYLLELLLAIVIFVAGYCVGYKQPFLISFLSSSSAVQETDSAKPTAKEVASKPAPKGYIVHKSVPSIGDDQSPKSIPATPLTPSPTSPMVITPTTKKTTKQPSEVLAYPQLENGDYYIVGIQGTEIMRPGKTLLNISIKYYKSKEFVEYICVMNDIKNPDVVPLDKELKIPELKHK